MKYSQRISINALFLVILMLISIVLSSCEDEALYKGSSSYIPEGEISINTEIHFSPLNEALTESGSRSAGLEIESGQTIAPTGDALGVIESLYILFYDEDGNLSKNADPIEVNLDLYKPTLEARVDEDASNGAAAEDSTYCVKFPLTVPYGNYKVFAVANVDNLLSEHKDAIETIEGLRGIKLTWVSNNISKNRQMFGYFTATKADTRGMNFEGDELIEIRPTTKNLHAWIRRAVSKITIDFDGTDLYENVKVFIKEARVYDISDGAYLGYYSCVGNTNSDQRDDNITPHGGFGLTQSSHRLCYGIGDDHLKWPMLVKGHKLDSYVDSKGDTIKYHDQRAYCLPFFENMQGKGAMKYQDADGNGSVDYPDAGEYEIGEDGEPIKGENGQYHKWNWPEAKDSKPNGTYVEVIGYYESGAENYVSTGPIKFRFMIGKDIKNDYDCERNHHYKLTLKFRGYGNDADWHIEYVEQPGIHLPNPLYISYLYNHNMKLPIRINTGGREIEWVKAEIISNNWAPDIEDWEDRDPEQRLIYNRQFDKDGEFGKKYPWNGFLSLVQTHERVIVAPDDKQYYTYNEVYWKKSYKDDELGENVYRHTRKYMVTPGEHGSDDPKTGLGKYTVTKGKDVVDMVIPLYTRAKNLIKQTAYTGNNPYVAYQRKAVVKVTCKLKGVTEPMTPATTTIYQVRRLVNPKGIYRNAGDNKDFDVILTILPRENADKFEITESKGPWRAYVLGNGSEFITLDGGSRVEGDGYTPVKFKVGFTGTCAEDESRFGVIRVEYHNYNCVHLIFVRQGDSPVEMFDAYSKNNKMRQVFWHTRNLKTKDSEVDNILDEGSMFRYNRLNYPIDASNNKYKKTPWINITPQDFKNENHPSTYKMADGSPSVSWETIGSGSATAAAAFPNPTVSGGNLYIAQVTDYYQLVPKTEQGFGVLYGNDATTIQMDIEKVYGYQRDENGKADGKYGMRGCFAYVADETSTRYGRSLFFPIGASGYGHRKHIGKHGGTWGDSEYANGVLRYSVGRTEYNNNNNTPLFYDLFMRPGAIYWSQKIEKIEGTDRVGLDINYFTFDFFYMDTSAWGDYVTDASNYNKSDACFIRCVDAIEK